MTTVKRWSYSAGECGRNRVRAYEDRTGLLLVEYYERQPGIARPLRTRVSLQHRDPARAKQQVDDMVAAFGRGTRPAGGPVPLATLFDIYGREVTPTKSSGKRQHDRACAEMFLRFFGAARDARSLNRRDWDRFIQARRAGTLAPVGKRTPAPVRNRQIEYDLRWLLDLRITNAANDAERVALLGEWATLEEEAFEAVDRAADLYRRVLELVPEDTTALTTLPRLLLAQGDAAWDYGGATLKTGGKAELDKLAKTIREGAGRDKRPTQVGSIIIVGHTDRTEVSGGKTDLDIARAEAVRDYLVSIGLDRKLMFWEGKDASEPMPPGLESVRQGNNGWGLAMYRGPAPPVGTAHEYDFTVYALDAALDLPPGLTRAELLAAIEGHVIGRGSLVATYTRVSADAAEASE